MYTLKTPLVAVQGIGPILSAALAEYNLYTVKDLLMWIPLRYEDRSQQVTIDSLKPNELVTLKAQVMSASHSYRGRRSMDTATISDGTAKVKLMWFNNKFIKDRLKKGEWYLFSGKLNDRHVIVQPVVENISDDTIHTNRLVPMYSLIKEMKAGSLRRILKNVIDNLVIKDDYLTELDPQAFLTLKDTFCQIHFPDQAETVIKARERLATEELLSLMKQSELIKQTWHDQKKAQTITVDTKQIAQLIPSSVPFTLTSGQIQALTDILTDLQQAIPMNRLLVGDVGSGKTVVAGIACYHLLQAGYNTALVAPTQILAQQHLATLVKLFPDLNVEVITGQTKIIAENTKPTLYVGTHAVINRLHIIKPALVIYDEQHRFGVEQRSRALPETTASSFTPHILTMSATPIPRSLMLTIFSHLHLSVISELPAGRKPVKTWVIPAAKRADALQWIAAQIKQESSQALIVCPFIDPSHSAALENVAAVTDRFKEISAFYAQKNSGFKPRLELLHGRLTKPQQAQITDKLYQREIDLLVTTPIVEVGVDLPAASMIVIEAAERFGLASLHQLRGRVGRAGQQAYCLLFTTSKSDTVHTRLEAFCHSHNGLELAELDLQRRGAGDLFGTEQHGFDQLRFAEWTNLTLITQARQLFERLHTRENWLPLFFNAPTTDKKAPAAN